jgi:hypothetical protein
VSPRSEPGQYSTVLLGRLTALPRQLRVCIFQLEDYRCKGFYDAAGRSIAGSHFILHGITFRAKQRVAAITRHAGRWRNWTPMSSPVGSAGYRTETSLHWQTPNVVNLVEEHQGQGLPTPGIERSR